MWVCVAGEWGFYEGEHNYCWCSPVEWMLNVCWVLFMDNSQWPQMSGSDPRPTFPDLSIATRSSWQYLWQQITAGGVMSAPIPRHVCNLSTRVTFGRSLNVSWFLSLRPIFSWISSPSQPEAIKQSINQLEVSKCPGHNRDRITFHYIAMSRRFLGPKPWASVHIYQKVSGVTFH